MQLKYNIGNRPLKNQYKPDVEDRIEESNPRIPKSDDRFWVKSNELHFKRIEDNQNQSRFWCTKPNNFLIDTLH